MAVPFIQLGQCGNQIGSSFYDIMFNQGAKSSSAHQCLLQQFFTLKENGSMKAKAFSIDMEPKVVNKNLNMQKQWSYRKDMSLVQEEGSGNNWAYGCKVHGPRVKEKLINIFRKYAQSEDYLKCFFQIQSMAGGTGSGLGTYILQLLIEIFPKIPKFMICIMPHLSGEVILQSYNACLSLGTVYPEADGIFLIQNDEINAICSKELKIQKISLQNINEVIGRNLSSVFFPVVNKNTKQIFSIEQNSFDYANDLVEKLFYDSRYKLSSIKTTPHGPKDSESFNFDSWQAIENELTYKKRHKSISEMMIVRGPDHPVVMRRNVFSLYDKHIFYSYNRSCTLLDNGQQFSVSLEKLIEKGYNMVKKDAYMYQYEKYGIEKDNFLECFSQIQNIQTNYSKLQ